MFKYFHITILSCAAFLKPLSAEEIKDGLYQELFENKLNVNIGATFDPYSINSNGIRINKVNISNG